MITSLQIVLAIVGVLLIAAVIAYNLWQERKYRQEASRLFNTRREDILLGEAVGMEPNKTSRVSDRAQLEVAYAPGQTPAPAETSGPPPVGGPTAVEHRPQTGKGLNVQVEELLGEVEDDGLVVPSHAETLTTRPPARPPAAAPVQETPQFHGESGLDEATEYIARVRFAQPAITSYLSLLEGLRRIGKPIRAMGKRPGEGWEPLSGHPAHALEGLEIGIQLADRNGAITAAQLERFCTLLYDFAAAEGGAVSCPDKQAALQQAKDLDLFCMQVDVLIGLTVAAREGHCLRGEDIQRMALEAGLTLGRDGVYHLLDETGRPQFSMANQDDEPFCEDMSGFTTNGVTLLFDVPKVANGLEVFDRMTRLGLHMADALSGRLVDDNGRQVNRESLQKDRDRLAAYYARMAQQGIEAGGERAMRLFV